MIIINTSDIHELQYPAIKWTDSNCFIVDHHMNVATWRPNLAPKLATVALSSNDIILEKNKVKRTQ